MKVKQFLKRLTKKNLVKVSIAAIVAVVIGFGLGTLTNKAVTSDKYAACMADEYVSFVGQAQMMKEVFGAPTEALISEVDKIAVVGGITPEQAVAAKKAVKFTYDKPYKHGALVEAFAECLNK